MTFEKDIKEEVLKEINKGDVYPLDNITIKESKMIDLTIQEYKKRVSDAINKVLMGNVDADALRIELKKELGLAKE